MPELAEVEYYRKQWNGGLKQKILSVQMHSGKRIFRGLALASFEQTIVGALFLESWAHGKQMLFHFSKNAWLGLHLGMTGKLRVEKSPFTPGKHDHLVLHQKKQALVFSDPRQFGRVLFHHGASEPAWWSNLPAPLISARFTLSSLKTFLKRHGKAPIKAVLLMQAGFPGVGNWMADEILWQSKIHPRLATGKIPEKNLKALFQKTRFVSAQALKIVGEDFSDPPKSWLFQYRWKKKGKCPRCGEILQHATIGGRTTCWCPACQK
ncbi:MAG: DNA-formamidopyrimidine glycosylase family protein [Verrucomicrobiota bacterium]